MLSFEDRVLEGLIRCGVQESSGTEFSPLHGPGDWSYTGIIVAVSGGSDSIALLAALAKLAADGRLPLRPCEGHSGQKITALTIDHNMRVPQESGGDARFVEDYCARLGVPCAVARFMRGEVESVARNRGMGMEEAARCLRYQAFERSLGETPDSILCTAHTQDDDLETILMRFLQGSASRPLAGIPARHGRIARPMLNITKRGVLGYLENHGITFRRDSTNDDTAYLRNNIRLNLIPLLNGHFPGWQKAVLAGAEKIRDDAEAIQARANEASFDAFFDQPRAVKRELVYRAWNALTRPLSGRLPYETVSRVCGGHLPVRYGGAVFEKNERGIVVRKAESPRDAREDGFFAFIEQSGTYMAGGWMFNAGDAGVRVEIPACVRSPLPTDRIVFSRGQTSLTKLFSSAKIPARERCRIPVLESKNAVAAVFGSALGKRDWISARAEQMADNRGENPASVCVKFEGSPHG